MITGPALALSRAVCRPSFLAGLLVIATMVPAAAQCALQWQPQGGYSGTDLDVWCMTMWDPDGAGPQQPRLVIGGRFTVVGAVQANGIATCDPVTGVWSPIGPGLTNVRALAVMPNGDLVAGGDFTSAGSVSINHIARWNGTSWMPLGSGMAGGLYTTVKALTVLPGGDLVAGGDFTSAGGVVANHIARWNGSTWSPLGAGMALQGTYPPSVTALTTMPNGHVVAGGWFTHAGGVLAVGIARWNGSSWSALGSSVNSVVTALYSLPNGDLVAGGEFGTPSVGIAHFNGSSWSAMGSGMWNGTALGSVTAITAMPNGDVVATGAFTTAGGVAANHIARWDGSTWSPLGTGVTLGQGFALAVLPNGSLMVGGSFTTAGGFAASKIARWNGSAWSPLNPALNGSILCSVPLPNGDLVVGGDFTATVGVIANRIAMRSGGIWSPLGAGTNDVVEALVTLPNGDVVAGGLFTAAGGVNTSRIARWNGSIWSPLGAGTNSTVFALAVLANGDLVAGGTFTIAGGVAANHIARWDGSNWSAMGTGVDNSVFALAALPNGDVIAGGAFSFAGAVGVSNVARWDGTSWSALGSGTNNRVSALVALGGADFAAAGQFTIAGGITVNEVARWSNGGWSALGSGVAVTGGQNGRALAVLPDGDLLLGGYFNSVGGFPTNNIARWNGTSWSILGSGVDSAVNTFAQLSGGALALGGLFTSAGGGVSPYFALLQTPCPASAVATGVGCTGSGGANVLTATALPWIGSTFRSIATGMPAIGIAVELIGLSPVALPLPPILPGLPGCSQLVTLDALDFLVPTAGSVSIAIPIPNSAALANAVLYQQVAPFEFDVLGALVAVTSTNRLTLTIGSF